MLGVCAEAGIALLLPISPEIRTLVEDAAVPKRVHDVKTAMHALHGQGIELRGRCDDSMLLFLRAQSDTRHADYC